MTYYVAVNDVGKFFSSDGWVSTVKEANLFFSVSSILLFLSRYYSDLSDFSIVPIEV